ncbi:MAG: VWA domain-containing protein [Acidobacteriota bacterium]|nr:VWA domain-containing protein [Acidobacteriota bacterium]
MNFRFDLKKSVLALFLLLGFTAGTSAQDDVVKVETTLVRLNVGVVDVKGNVITNLNKDSFTVYEDDIKQNITRFEPVSAPFSIVMMLDISGSTKSFRQQMAQAASRFTDALSPQDRVAVMTFNEKPELLTNFTTNQKDIKYAISLVGSSGKAGRTMFYKALDEALKKLSKETSRRKAVVVLTDGIDTELEAADRKIAGNSQTAEEAANLIKPEQNRTLSQILDTADRLGVTVYPLALPSGDPNRLPDPMPFQIVRYKAARERLQLLANRTGGQLNTINRLDEMSRLYAIIAADLRTLYSIEYEPPADRPRDGKWRTIKLEVNRPELVVRTRPGYYAR